jgi:hypothetical protein
MLRCLTPRGGTEAPWQLLLVLVVVVVVVMVLVLQS